MLKNEKDLKKYFKTNKEELKNILAGKIPVKDKSILVYLISSHGRINTFNNTNGIRIEPTFCYPLENLNVSKIEDFSGVFYGSLYNGNLSKWKFKSAKILDYMFAYSFFNNDSLSNIDFKKIISAEKMFFRANFNGDISSWYNFDQTNFNLIFFENNGNKFKDLAQNRKKSFFKKDIDINSNYRTILWLQENKEKTSKYYFDREKDILKYFNLKQENKNISRIKKIFDIFR